MKTLSGRCSFVLSSVTVGRANSESRKTSNRPAGIFFAFEIDVQPGFLRIPMNRNVPLNAFELRHLFRNQFCSVVQMASLLHREWT